MNIDIKNMTQDQIDDLKVQIEAFEVKKMPQKLAWKPKHTEDYFGIDYRGGSRTFRNNYQPYIYSMANVDNCFQTPELRDAELERRQILHRIHEWIDENDAERGGRFIVGGYNYVIEYYVDSDTLSLDYYRNLITNPLIPCFSSAEKRAQCIEDIGEDNIKLLFKRYEIVRGE